MSNRFNRKIVSANDLLDGRVVYLTAAHTWSPDRGAAWVAEDAGTAAVLLDAAVAEPRAVVGPYLVDVKLSAQGVPEPCDFREAVRAHGPTVGGNTEHPSPYRAGSPVAGEH